MSITLVTTIGTGDYFPTTYTFSTQESYKTGYVAEAICRMKGIPKVIFLLTQEARAKHWDPLQTCFAALGIKIEDRDIPDGQTEAETWQIFDTLVEAIEPHSQVIFDVTHAFRSIPILVLLGAAFLRKAKNVEIQGLYYGLYRPKQETTPIVDLTPALRLLDWLTATDTFISTGSAQELGALLNTVQRDFHRQHRPGKGDPKPVKLQGFGSTIQDISRSIELIRPVSLLEDDLPKLLRQSTTELAEEVGTFAKPFGLLLETIQNSYAALALPSDTTDERQQIHKQFLLLEWYVNKQFTAQAILLAREWVVSALCVGEGIRNYRERVYREVIERQLGAMTGKGDNPGLEQPISRQVADPKKLKDLWSQLTDYRNDVAHVQMRKSPFDGKTLEDFALKQLVPSLKALFPTLTQVQEERKTLEGIPSQDL